MRHRLAAGAAAVLLLLTSSSCSTADDINNFLFSTPPPAGTPGLVRGFLGGVVADEPRAALVGRDVLSGGGTAADAAVAIGFALAVTLPSRAGLAGGGACLAYTPSRSGPNGGVPEAIMFVPPAPANGGGDRPAAVPLLARGLFALHARYGSRPFETLITPAEQMARLGVPASRAFIRDLDVVARPLAADPGANAIFFRGGNPVPEGATIVQPDLAATIAQIRVSGVGDFYQGGEAKRIEDAMPAAGAAVTAADLRAALPKLAPVLTVTTRAHDIATFLPPPADGGLAAASAFKALSANPTAVEAAGARGLGTATLWRRSGGDPAAVLAAEPPPPGLPALPASTTFVTLDRDGNAVVCALTMNNLFGTGRIAPGTGMVLAASPNWVPPPLLSASIVYNANLHAFRAAVGGSGQNGAPLATAFALVEALNDSAVPPRPMPVEVPDPGRANVIECNQYLPGARDSCGWANDIRGAGLAIGSN
jgi:gamma-glutamyltranspeptidase/glutathione hydrolase